MRDIPKAAVGHALSPGAGGLLGGRCWAVRQEREVLGDGPAEGGRGALVGVQGEAHYFCRGEAQTRRG